MKLHALRQFALTAAIVVGGGALGWIGARVVTPATAVPLVEAGNFSPLIADAHHPFVLFVSSTCPYCRKARALLDSIPVDYFTYEIDTSAEAKQLYRTLGVDRVPVLITANARITGFSADVYRARTDSALAPRHEEEKRNGANPAPGS